MGQLTSVEILANGTWVRLKYTYLGIFNCVLFFILALVCLLRECSERIFRYAYALTSISRSYPAEQVSRLSVCSLLDIYSCIAFVVMVLLGPPPDHLLTF